MAHSRPGGRVLGARDTRIAIVWLVDAEVHCRAVRHPHDVLPECRGRLSFLGDERVCELGEFSAFALARYSGVVLVLVLEGSGVHRRRPWGLRGPRRCLPAVRERSLEAHVMAVRG